MFFAVDTLPLVLRRLIFVRFSFLDALLRRFLTVRGLCIGCVFFVLPNSKFFFSRTVNVDEDAPGCTKLDLARVELSLNGTLFSFLEAVKNLSYLCFLVLFFPFGILKLLCRIFRAWLGALGAPLDMFKLVVA